MAVMTIRNIDAHLKQKLRIRAAQHGRSMEEEVRTILRSALSSEPSPETDMGQLIHRRFARLEGVDLPLPTREAIRDIDLGT